MFYNGDSIPFLQKLEESGRETALSAIPKLDEDGQDLWRMYCFIGDDVLVSLDIYERRIGLPDDWEFEECAVLISRMKGKALELQKLKRENDRQHSKH